MQRIGLALVLVWGGVIGISAGEPINANGRGGMQTIVTDKAPAAIGPYSQAVVAGDFIYCSGQIGINPASGKLVGDDVESQTRQVLDNLQHVLLAAGVGLPDVVKTTIYLQDMQDFAVVNAIYGECFGGHKPARATVQVAGLPLGARVEIECVAYRSARD